MKEDIKQNVLPEILDAQQLSKYLGISIGKAYSLLNDENFPTLKIGSRLFVSDERLAIWLAKQTRNVIDEGGKKWVKE